VLNLIEALSRLGPVAAVWHWSVIAVFRMEAVIYVAVKTLSAMKPWAGANENAARKPLRAVVAVRSAVVGSDVIVTVGAYRRNANVDADGYLSLCFGSGYHKADCN
jgi:hypothetical protein